MSQENERLELEKQIIKCRALSRLTADEVARQRINTLIFEIEQKLRRIDERGRPG